MRVIITDNYHELSARAADLVLAQIWEKPNSVLGLATGSTPLGLYKELIKNHQAERVNFSRVTTFNLDEYYGLSPQDKRSYNYFTWFNFLSHVNIQATNVFIPDGSLDKSQIQDHCRQYEKAISDRGGIDLQILGIGKNGHVAFNEPGSSFTETTRLVNLSHSTLVANSRFFKNSSGVPRQAISMGLGTITRARKVILLASGKDKAEAVARAIEGRVDKSCPASVLQLFPDVTFIIDQAAASKLKKNYRSPLSLLDHRFKVLTKDSLPQDKVVVVISPHPDDASISLGGMIAGLAKRNKVHTFVMTTGYRSFISGQDKEQRIKIREHEVEEEARILGAQAHFLHLSFYDAKNQSQAMAGDAKKVRQLFDDLEPDIIFLPHKNDKHPTHIGSREVVKKALPMFRLFDRKAIELWHYEGPWAVFNEGEFNTIFAFSEDLMSCKMEAIRAQHSQIERTRFDVAAESLARLRAAVIPEQSLFGLGQKSLKLGEYFELFNVIRR